MKRKLLIKAKHVARSFSPVKYALPQFLIIGAQKCGTSSLYSYLIQHPEVLASTRKEVGFFSEKYEKGSSWYRARFPSLQEINSGFICGEATPEYFFHPHAARRIHELLPDIRLILLLRNPVDRAISHYYHSVKKGHEDLTLEDALNAEEERITDAMEEMVRDENAYSVDWQRYSYKSRGIYCTQLQRYYDYFDREQILIIPSKELFESSGPVMKKIQSYLGISDFAGFDYSIENIGRYQKNRIPEKVYLMLEEYFRPYNERLFELTHVDYGWNT